MLTGSGLSKAHGTRVLFSDVTVTLSPGRRVALVGGNGTGKTTLLEILAGEQRPDSGTVTRPSTHTVAYLPQDRTETPDGSALDEALRGAGGIVDLARRIEELQHAVAASAGAEHDRMLRDLGNAQTAFETRGGYAIEAEAHRVLAGLGFTDTDRRRPLAELSGGWRMRAALARILVARPDVLLLDEPLARIDPDRRAVVRADLVRLQELYGVTILWVTADQADALAVAHRVAVLIQGKLEQVGAPMDLYRRPRTLAVARFVGEPEIGVVRIEIGGRPIDLGIRPHELRPAAPGADGLRFRAAVVAVEILGRRAVATLEVDGGVLRWDGAPVTTRVGDRVEVLADLARAHRFDPATGVAVWHPE